METEDRRRSRGSSARRRAKSVERPEIEEIGDKGWKDERENKIQYIQLLLEGHLTAEAAIKSLRIPQELIQDDDPEIPEYGNCRTVSVCENGSYNRGEDVGVEGEEV